MPSFLNKVFGYKKHDDKEATRPAREPSDSTLLDGKYEAIPSVLSPIVSTFAEAQPTKEPERDSGFSLFKSRGRAFQKAQKQHGNVPHLTLRLPGPKENSDSRALNVVFEADPDSQIVLSDAIIAEKRLSPLEALILIRACTRAITEHGLETLGIMHPHWFSASPDAQRKLISLFIRSLTQSPITTLSPTPNSSSSAFENELRYTRSPHDVAAVLRWGLRHLSLENGHFGKGGPEWGWYDAFFQAERSASYPPKGFSESLLPQLPASHIELLTATLNLISSLASHAETNSISGSKLSKFLGLWLLASTRSEQFDDWGRFYARWERNGRILEHLFLARLREESFGQRLPTRLQELVKYYPYNKGSPASDDDLLARPRFSTHQYDALFVRVESLLAGAEQPKRHPVQLLLEAFQLPVDNPLGNEHIALWSTLKATAFEKATSSDPEGPQFARIFVDETILLLSLIPTDNNLPTSPTFFTTPISQVVSRKRSSSLTRVIERTTYKSSANDGSTPVSPTSPSSIVITDWAQFTLSGFGDTPATPTLPAISSHDDDIEVTQPRMSRKSSRRRGKSHRQGSEDHEALDTASSSHADPGPSVIETKLASVHVVQIDEAFIDFWSDAIVDPISANWPPFILCGLKQIPSAEQSIKWLVIEQVYTHQEPSRVPSPDGRRGRSPRPSFKSDISGLRINSVFTSARKRFSLFSKSVTDLDPKKPGGKSPVAGELGEILVEEEPTSSSVPPAKAGLHVDENADAKITVASGAALDVYDQPKSAAPVAPTSPASKEESGSAQEAVKGPSIEPTPPSGVVQNGCSTPSHPSVRFSEEIISTEREYLPADAAADSSANQITDVFPLVMDTASSRSIQGATPSGPVSIAENSVDEEVHSQAGRVLQVVAGVQSVEHVAQREDRDEHLQASFTNKPAVDVASNDSREDATVVVIPQTQTVAVVAGIPVAQSTLVALVDNTVSEHTTVEESFVDTQPQQRASADPAAAITVEPARQRDIDDLSPVSAVEVIATEVGAQVEPHLTSPIVDEREEARELAERVEIPTPTPEFPDQEVSVLSGATQATAAKPNTVDNTAPQLVALDDAASQPVAAESQTTLDVEGTHPLETQCDDAISAVDTDLQAVNVETEHAADQVPAQYHVQDTVVLPAEAHLVESVVEADFSALNVRVEVAAEVEAQATAEVFVHEDHHIVGETEAPTLVPEQAQFVDETHGPEIAVHTQGPLATTTSEQGVESETRDNVVETVVKDRASLDMPVAEEDELSSGAELPTQIDELQPVALSIGTYPVADLATPDEVIAVSAVGQLAHDAPSEDVEASVTESTPVEALAEASNEANGPSQNMIFEHELVEDKAAELIIEEPEVLAREVEPITSESVAITPTPIVTIQELATHDVQTPTEIVCLSSESTPQFANEAANSPSADVVSEPEEPIVIATQAVVGSEADAEEVHPSVNTVGGPFIEDAEPEFVEPEQVDVTVSLPLVEDAPELAEKSFPVTIEVSDDERTPPTVEIGETAQIGEPKQTQVVEQSATSESEVTHESAELS